MREPEWISKPVVLALHCEQLAEHRGSSGVRDETLLDSAPGKPRNVFADEEAPTLFRLAASYAFGVAPNHAFVDGNKRTALVVSLTFLNLNGSDIAASREETYRTFLGLAEGSLSEHDLASWLASHAVRFQL